MTIGTQTGSSRLAVIVLAVFVEATILGVVVPITLALFDPSDGLMAKQFADPVNRDLALAFSFAALPASVILFGLFAARFADYRGRRPIVITALLLSAGGNLVSGLGALAGSPLVFCIGRAIAGLSGAAAGTILAIFADVAVGAGNRLRRMAWAIATATCGVAFGYLIANLTLALMSDLDLVDAIPFLVVGLVGMVNALAFAALMPETLRRRAARIREDSDEGTSFWRRGHGAGLMRLTVIHLGMTFSWSGLFHTAGDTLLRRYGIEDWQLATVAGVASLLLAVTAFLIPQFLHRLVGYGPSIGYSGTLMGISIMALALAFDPLVACLIAVVLLPAFICQEVCKLAYVADWAGDVLRGRFLTFFTLLSAFAIMASFLATGLLVRVSDLLMLAVLGFIGTLASTLAFSLRDPEPPRVMDPEDTYEITGMHGRLRY